MSYLKEYLPYLFGNKVGQKPMLPEILYFDELSFEEKLMFSTFKGEQNKLFHSLNLFELSAKERFHLINFYQFFDASIKREIDAKLHEERKFYRDALHFDLLGIKGAEELLARETAELTVYVALRKNREELGRLIIKKANGEFYRKRNGKIWSIPILGLSSRGLSFHHTNGCTPCGVYRINGVMPEANKFEEFGRYRRLVLDFIEESPDEEKLKTYLPMNHYERHWWKQSVLARTLGRSLLRIHGTGLKNKKFFSKYYPFVPTSGCLATNEVESLFKKIHQQRELLDALMDAQELPINFENESHIKALLYVFELDDKKGRVRVSELGVK